MYFRKLCRLHTYVTFVFGFIFGFFIFILYFTQSSTDPNFRMFQCKDIEPKQYWGQRGQYWVFYNFLTPNRRFRCDESVTYTTQAEYTYLDNLQPLLSRWQGPVSIALYTPGKDFHEAISRIYYLRQCTPFVKELVTFHLFFEAENIPKDLKKFHDYLEIDSKISKIDCKVAIQFGSGIRTWRREYNLTYPINVGRNIARDMATTHFVLASDIELYPSPRLIPQFLAMVQDKRSNLEFQDLKYKKVFVLPVFEVEASVMVLPEDKQELKEMLRNKTAVSFHKFICNQCHQIPKAKDWQNANMTPGLKVFNIAKRKRPFNNWEPFYIGTKLDPTYDERLSWEGMRNKMPQAYALCILDYEFHILDNAFLIHRPGIRKIPKKAGRIARKQSILIRDTVRKELNLLYGRRQDCL